MAKPAEPIEPVDLTELEKQDRLGYEAQPQCMAEVRAWESIAAWPDED
jgi:hypothetical protein